MDPITIALLSGAIGGIIGWLFGASEAQEAIAQLQKMVLELQELNRQREAEIGRLRGRVQQLEREVASIKASRGAVMNFFRWLTREEPQVLERYLRLREADEQAATIEMEIRADGDAIDQKVQRLRALYPDEMSRLASRL